MNYFLLFHLPEKFDIKIEVLSKNFYQLQRKFHPDLFNNHSESIKIEMLKNSTMINKGYKILKDPLTRAEYLLSLHGFNITRENNLMYEKRFLTEQYLFYEEIENLKEKFNLNDFNYLLQRINKIKENYEYEMRKAFGIRNWDRAALVVGKLFFFKNLKNNLDKLNQ